MLESTYHLRIFHPPPKYTQRGSKRTLHQSSKKDRCKGNDRILEELPSGYSLWTSTDNGNCSHWTGLPVLGADAGIQGEKEEAGCHHCTGSELRQWSDRFRPRDLCHWLNYHLSSELTSFSKKALSVATDHHRYSKPLHPFPDASFFCFPSFFFGLFKSWVCCGSMGNS